MAAPAAPAGAIYIGGAALFAGAVYLATPQGQRTANSLGEAMGKGASDAVSNIASLFEGERDDEGAVPVPTTDTGTRPCDGPHRGRFQAQGYDPRREPAPIEISRPWNRACHPPLRSEGHVMLSQSLLSDVRARSFVSAGIRQAAFIKMSQHLSKSPVDGWYAITTIGWGVDRNNNTVRNIRAGLNAPRVDMEILAGRAFGIR